MSQAEATVGSGARVTEVTHPLVQHKLGLLLRPEDVEVPMVDTAHAHARAVVDYAA